MPFLRWCHLGRVEYATARSLQCRLATQRARRRARAGDPGTPLVARGDELLLFLEHPPVLTLGRNAAPPPGDVRAIRTDRGGGLTYHGPGQLVGYPVVALGAAGRGVRSFVAVLEAALCETARAFGVEAERRDGLPGIWTAGPEGWRKLASVGLGVRRGVTVHGCALNVEVRAEQGFAGFDPCGLRGVRVTSLARERGGDAPGLREVASALAAALARGLGLPERECRPEDLDAEPRQDVPAGHPRAHPALGSHVSVDHGHRPTP